MMTSMINQNQYGLYASACRNFTKWKKGETFLLESRAEKFERKKNPIKNLFAVGKINSDPNSLGGLGPAELGKVSQVVNEVMTRDTAVAGDHNRLYEWRTEADYRPI